MVDFRKGIIALAVLALFAGLASAQVGGSGQQSQLTCSTGVTFTPQLRQEGWTEQTGDITITCTGGSLNGITTAGSQISQVNFTIFYNTNVTSRLFGTGSNAPNEALLMIDEPGSGLPGAGPQRAQKLCPTPASGCPAVVNYDGLGNIYSATSTAACEDSSTCSNYAYNVYQGTAASATGNAVTFFGVPVLPPTTTGQRVFRITNVRVNAVPVANQGAVNASITVSPNSLGITQSVLNVGFVAKSLETSTGAKTVQQCVSASAKSNFGGLLTFTEDFGTAFKTRIAAQANTAFAAQGTPGLNGLLNQNVPGAIYNSESNFVVGVSGGTAGLADFGTRLKATFNNIPSGVRIFVSTSNVINAGNPVGAPSPQGGTSTSSYAKLITGDTVGYGTLPPDGTSAPFLSAPTGADPFGSTGIVEVVMSGGTGTATWEVINTNPNTNESFNFGYYVTVAPSLSTNLPTPGVSTVNMSYAPNATSGVAAGTSTSIPRFRGDQDAARTLVTVIVCRTILLFPYVVNQIGLDTGIAIANTSQDPFTTGSNATQAQSGECTLSFYASDPAATSPANAKILVAGGTTTTIAGGKSGIGLLSAFAPGFQGYMFAVCNFQWAHGFAFISDVGLRNLAMGYLAVVLDDPGTSGRFQRNTQTTENGAH